jgi:hypothetical protein
VIFEQFGQLAGITAYLHIHVELSISSVEAQLMIYCQLLNQICDSELSVLNYMLTYVNTSITNFTLKKDFPDRPEDFPEKSMIRQNAKLWYKVAQLHLRDLEDMEESIATLRKSLPVVPNRNTGKIPVQAQFAPPQGAHVINMQAYSDTHDHLLTLIPEKSPMNLRTSSQGSVEIPEPRNITRSSSAGKTTGPTISKAGRSQGPRDTEREDQRAPEFIWGRKWNFPGRGTSQPLTPEAMDEMTLIRPRREILGGITLGVAVAATAMGVYNRVQIEELKAELFEIKENTGRLFEVVQDFSQNMAALETGFNEIQTTLLYQVMFNPTLFDSRLSRLENQLRGRLRRVTHAIQAAMHQRFAIDYLNPAELVNLFQQLARRADEAGCELLIQYHSDLFQVETSLLFDGQDGHLLIHVPMVTKGILLWLFRLHPFPLPMFETHHLMIDAEDDILAISSTETRYNIQLSSMDLLSCHRMNQVFMCNSFGVMSKRFNDTCLGALYMQRFELVHGLCKFRVVPLKEQVYQVRKGQYLVYSPEASTANMRCRNGSHHEIHLQRGMQQIKIPPGCQGFFLDNLATSDYSVRLASEVLHYGWDWDPLTLLPAGDIANMGRMLCNLSDLHLHHPDLLELQYITRQNMSMADIGHLDLGLQGLTSSVSSYFASFGTGMGATIILIIVGLSYLNCRRGESAAFHWAHCGPSTGCGPGSGSGPSHHLGPCPFGSITTNPDGANPSVLAQATMEGKKLLCWRWFGRRLQRPVLGRSGGIGDAPGPVQLRQPAWHGSQVVWQTLWQNDVRGLWHRVAQPHGASGSVAVFLELKPFGLSR